MEQLHKDIIELREKLRTYGIDDTHIVYMPVSPRFLGLQEVVVEEHCGMKVVWLVQGSDD